MDIESRLDRETLTHSLPLVSASRLAHLCRSRPPRLHSRAGNLTFIEFGRLEL